MAIRSYDPRYVENVADTIGTMFHYAVSCGYIPIDFWNIFVDSYVAKQIEYGNPRFLFGYSAIDLLLMVLDEADVKGKIPVIVPFYGRSAFYWAGWALAQYQNYKGISFYRLNKAFPIADVLYLYDTLHEADITKFFDLADRKVTEHRNDTRLKTIRKAAGLSQQELADKAKVSIRAIQMYEQRKIDINKAQVDIVFRLSKVLGCTIEDLLEI